MLRTGLVLGITVATEAFSSTGAGTGEGVGEGVCAADGRAGFWSASS